MNCASPKPVDPAILRFEAGLAAAGNAERERISRALEENICAVLEDALRTKTYVRTPAAYKFSADPDDPEAFVFTLLRFEAKIYAD